jgi:RNA polymerase sigma-B factor
MIARHLGLDRDEVIEARSVAQAYRCRSLDAAWLREDGRGPTLGDTVGDLDPGYEQVDARLALRHALERVKPRDRTVLLLRFGAGLTQNEIARQIGVSQMQISRILKATTASLASSLDLTVMDSPATPKLKEASSSGAIDGPVAASRCRTPLKVG